MQNQTATPTLDDRVVPTTQPSKRDQNRFRSHQAMARFGSAVTLMLTSPRHRKLSIAMLRRTLIPALTRGQLQLVEAGRPDTGETAPVAMLLWAKVSDKTHHRLMRDLDRAIILDPTEWDDGDNYWIVDAIGEERFLSPVIKNLREKELKGKTVHFRVKNDDGVSVRTL